MRRPLRVTVTSVLILALTVLAETPADPSRHAGGSETAARRRDSAAGSDGGPQPSFSDYGIVLKRNVFDPKRGAPVPVKRAPAQPSKPIAAKKVPDYIELSGILLADDATTVFLNGSRSEWRGARTVAPGDAAGPGVITAVDSHGVTLKIGETETAWPVGTRLCQTGDDWSIANTTDATPVSLPASGGRKRISPASPQARNVNRNTSGNRQDMLKRLMERRQKEESR